MAGLTGQRGTIRFLVSSDVDRILRQLYQGTRPAGVRFLICACGRVAALGVSDGEAVGWQILPIPICPDCLDPKPYMGPARDRYLALVEKLTKES